MEAQTKSLYDHGCPTSQDALTHTAGAPASGHPGTAQVSSVRPEEEEVGDEKKETSTALVWQRVGQTCRGESNPPVC